MAIQTNAGAVLNNPFPFPLPPATHVDAVAAINALSYANLWAAPGTQTIVGTMRVDCQGHTGTGQANLQLQVNGARGHTTVACILIDATAQSVAPRPNNATRVTAQQAEIRRVAVAAFMNSLQDFELGNPRIWRVTGTPSS
ncbi:hypothetical protein [Hyalangium versicolor]|uniref:hypothetical protein n=1 Tax=Hyalangium versicolor TaxID=2861190 RepID=UPI001CCB8E91|nr:hypothetical protein [Hyalangium versicolor]